MSHRSRVPLLAYMALIAAASSCDLGGPTVTAPADSVAQSGDLNASLLVRTTPGGPLAGLTGDQLALFPRGSGVFQRVLQPQTGLGPLFNAAGCSAWHEAPVPGCGGRDGPAEGGAEQECLRPTFRH